MKTKLKFIIPIVIAVIAIIIAALCINFTPQERADVSSLMSTAQKYLIENQYEQAIAEFNKVIELEPMNVDAYIGIAGAYIGMGDTEKAVEILEKGYALTGDERLKNMINELNSENSVAETTTLTTVTVSEVTTIATAPENEIVNNDDGSYYEIAFNTAGNIIHEDFYDENGNWWGSADIEYYPNGNKKSETYYRDNGSYYVSEYNMDEKIIKKTNYNADGSIYFYELYEYDSNNNLLSNMSYYGDESLRRYFKYEYDSNNYEVYYEFYNSIRYCKETFTDESKWKEETLIWNVKYNDDYTISYTYPINNIEGEFQLLGEKGIRECYAYYVLDNSYSHFICEFNEHGKKSLIKHYHYDNYSNSETYSGYTEHSYDKNGNLISDKFYYKNYESNEIELSFYSNYIYDGLGNNIASTLYNNDGSIYAKHQY